MKDEVQVHWETKVHCDVCGGHGKYLVEDVTYVPYGSHHTAMHSHDVVECSACDGSGLGEYDGCFICGEEFEVGDILNIVRNHLVHEGCADEPWPTDGELITPERDIYEP